MENDEIKIKIGDINEDDQAGNLYNALCYLTAYYSNLSMTDEMIARVLELKAHEVNDA